MFSPAVFQRKLKMLSSRARISLKAIKRKFSFRKLMLQRRMEQYTEANHAVQKLEEARSAENVRFKERMAYLKEQIRTERVKHVRNLRMIGMSASLAERHLNNVTTELYVERNQLEVETMAWLQKESDVLKVAAGANV